MIPNRSQTFSALRHWPTIVVLVYTLAAFSWSMPNDLFPFKGPIDSFSRRPLLFLNLWQAWDMFAPNPRSDDIWTEALYTNRDGTLHHWNLSNMIELPYGERYQRERWRKYFNDHLRMDSEERLWRPFAEYAIRHLRDEGQEPIAIDLVRSWRPAMFPVSPDLRADVRVSPWSRYTFFHWVPLENSVQAKSGGNEK